MSVGKKKNQIKNEKKRKIFNKGNKGINIAEQKGKDLRRSIKKCLKKMKIRKMLNIDVRYNKQDKD